MKNIKIIITKEIISYLVSPMAYIVSAVFICISGIFFTAYLVGTAYSDTSLKGFFSAGQFLILVFSTLLTMRLIAEEKKLGTWELLMTVPVNETEIVLGKFFASLVVLGGMLALTFYYPLMLWIFGDPDWGPVFTGYIGLFLLGAVGLSIGIFSSSLCSNQIASAVIAGGILFGLWFMGLGRAAPGGIGFFIEFLSLSRHFPDFMGGIIDTRELVYYISIIALFLYLAVWEIEAARRR